MHKSKNRKKWKAQKFCIKWIKKIIKEVVLNINEKSNENQIE